MGTGDNGRVQEQLRRVATTVGDFIRYWGFRRIHGQIWTELYLSKEGLSGADLTRFLDVSKALVSPAIAELVEHDLIFQIDSDAKAKLYRANPEVFRVIKKILQTRERKLIKKTETEFEKLKKLAANDPDSSLDPERIESLGSMIGCASQVVDLVVGLTSEEGLENWMSLLENAEELTTE